MRHIIYIYISLIYIYIYIIIFYIQPQHVSAVSLATFLWIWWSCPCVQSLRCRRCKWRLTRLRNVDTPPELRVEDAYGFIMIYSDLSAVDSCGILLGTYFQLFEMYWVTVYYIGLLFDQSFEVLYVLIPSTSGVIQMPHFGGESGSPPGSGGGGF